MGCNDWAIVSGPLLNSFLKYGFLFSLLENRYHLNTSLVFTKEVATLKGLADFVERRAA